MYIETAPKKRRGLFPSPLTYIREQIGGNWESSLRVLYLSEDGSFIQLEQVSSVDLERAERLGEGIACKAFDLHAAGILLARTDPVSSELNAEDRKLANATMKYCSAVDVAFLDYNVLSPRERLSMMFGRLYRES